MNAKDNLGGILADSEWKDNGDGTFSRNNVTLKIGDYVNYTYDTADAYALTKAHSGYTKDQTITQTIGIQWRVLGINEKGELELISETQVSNRVYLKGATGYNNGVYLLNDICKSHYSNNKLKISARSLTIDDIEEQLSEAGIKKRDEYIIPGTGVEYGDTVTSVEYNIYPTLYAEEAKSGVNGFIRDGGIDESDPYYKNKENLSLAYDTSGNELTTSMKKASGSLVTTQTSYTLLSEETNYFKNQIFHNMIFEAGPKYETQYWIASRSVDAGNISTFGLFKADVSMYSGESIYSSTGRGYSNSMYIRPVVTINSYNNITGSGENIGTVDNMWQLN